TPRRALTAAGGPPIVLSPEGARDAQLASGLLEWVEGGSPEMAQANEMTGGEAMARMLKAFKSGPMFGMGGFQLLAFYDAARRLKLDHHLINDERCGAFAADAYAKVSGRVGLVDATLGPGATNLATGLVEALNAGTPVVA